MKTRLVSFKFKENTSDAQQEKTFSHLRGMWGVQYAGPCGLERLEEWMWVQTGADYQEVLTYLDGLDFVESAEVNAERRLIFQKV